MDVTNGIDAAAVVLVGMLTGENFGKAVLKMSNLLWGVIRSGILPKYYLFLL